MVRVRPGDPKRHWEKADAVREVVDAALGIAAGPLRQAQASEAYLMVAEKRVVGFLLAEPLEATDKLERSFLRGESRVVASPGKVSRVGHIHGPQLLIFFLNKILPLTRTMKIRHKT